MAAASAALRCREFSQAPGTAPGNAAHTSGVTLRTGATARMSVVPEA
jgi:hypothetical protein